MSAAVVATASYGAPGGELSVVTYANGTSLDSISRNAAGETTGLAWKAGATTLATDAVTRSRTQRVLTETVDASLSSSFTYDPAGRLTNATVGANTYSYGYSGPGDSLTFIVSGLSTQRHFGLL